MTFQIHLTDCMEWLPTSAENSFHAIITDPPYGMIEYSEKELRKLRIGKGGFRPKLAETEFKDVCSMPRSCWEPWAILRKPFVGRLSQNLTKWGTGGLRRDPDGNPFPDVVQSTRTPLQERQLASHPSLKPQSFMRRLVWASLPLGKGRIVDPFCGAGSAIAAAEFFGYESVGIEVDPEYYELARKS